MTRNDIIAYLGQWSLIGALAFSIFVITVFRSGLVYLSRKEDGTLKKKIPLGGLLLMGGFLLLILGLLLLANQIGLRRWAADLTYLSLFLLNFGLYLILFLYDTIVIDGLVLGRWRPSFLRLPPALGSESMKKHILISLPVGTFFGLVLTAVSAAITHVLLWS